MVDDSNKESTYPTVSKIGLLMMMMMLYVLIKVLLLCLIPNILTILAHGFTGSSRRPKVLCKIFEVTMCDIIKLQC